MSGLLFKQEQRLWSTSGVFAEPTKMLKRSA